MKDLIIGFEFEGGVAVPLWDNFERSLRYLGVNDIGNDSSVYIDDEPCDAVLNDGLPHTQYVSFASVEFRTPALPYKEGVAMLEEILCFLYIMTESGIFRTNNTCGFHINISNKSLRNKQHAHFFCRFAQLFDEHAVLSTFKRRGNEFCRPFIHKSRRRTFRESVRRFYVLGGNIQSKYCPDKYRAVTLRSCINGRVEIRAPGNTNYQVRYKEICNILSNIEKCATEATEYIHSNHINSTSSLHSVLSKYASEEQAAVNLVNRRE